LSCDSSEDEAERRLNAALAEHFAEPRKRTRVPTPPEFQTPAGRMAFRLWRQLRLHRMNKALFENWWALLPSEIQVKIDEAIKPYTSWQKLLESYREQQRPDIPLIEIGDEVPLWGALVGTLPRLEFEKFVSLLEAPVRERKAYAEWFGGQVTRTLKNVLDVRPHRPSTKPSKLDLADDWWVRRLAAYIFNYPVKVR
jgi:hypothetical protein